MSWQQDHSGFFLPEDFFDDYDKAKDRISRLEQSVRNLYEFWGAWTTFPFNVNWATGGGGDQLCQYRINAAGDVQCRGVAIAVTDFTFGIGNAVMGSLPAATYPVKDQMFDTYLYDAFGGTGIGGTMVQIFVEGTDGGFGSPGRVSVVRDITGRTPTKKGGSTYVGLDAINYSIR